MKKDNLLSFQVALTAKRAAEKIAKKRLLQPDENTPEMGLLESAENLVEEWGKFKKSAIKEIEKGEKL